MAKEEATILKGLALRSNPKTATLLPLFAHFPFLKVLLRCAVWRRGGHNAKAAALGSASPDGHSVPVAGSSATQEDGK